VSFAPTTLCVASQRVFIVVSVYFVTNQSGNFWIHPRRRFLRYNGESSSEALGFLVYITMLSLLNCMGLGASNGRTAMNVELRMAWNKTLVVYFKGQSRDCGPQGDRDRWGELDSDGSG
jgi:hypothetical protein